LSLVATAFYSIIYYFLSPSFPEVALIAFVVTFLTFILFEDRLRPVILKVARKQYYLVSTQSQQDLETLNTNLNSARRFHEVTVTLFDSFDKLFPRMPFAFYIYEDNKYLLYHHQNISDNEILALDIKPEYFSTVSINSLLIESFSGSGFPESIINKYRQSGLTSVLPFRGHNQIFAFLVINHRKIPFFRTLPIWKLLEKIQKKAGLILENTALFIDLERKDFETRKLIEISQRILASLDIKHILDFILISLKELIDYDAAAIFLLDKDGKGLLNTSYQGYDLSVIDKLHLKVGQGSCGWAVKTKKVNILDDVRQAEHYMSIRPETRSQISIPILFDHSVLGVLCVESDRLSFFNQNLSELLMLFTNLAAIAIHNALQVDIRLAKQAYELELIHASAVQQRLLVQQFPRIKELSLIAANIPSKIISGDLYDVIRYSENIVGVAIGDVSGKGAPAALMMTLILANLRSEKRSYYTACDLVYRLNNMLYESTIPGKYATFFYGIFAQDEHKLIYTNAGHNPPIFVTANGEIKRLREGGIVLGFLANAEYIQKEIHFEKGDLFVGYTDGITEAMNAAEEEYGEDRLIRVILANRHLPVYAIKELIMKAVVEFSSMDTPADDMTLLICKHD
jgi:sigma-B regulation protein RsbU (phosphoserine phosphatase)